MPASQGDLIRAARGELTQSEFAKRLGVHASCLSRYEREQLGAPTKVLNFCLKTLALHKAAVSILTELPPPCSLKPLPASLSKRGPKTARLLAVPCCTGLLTLFIELSWPPTFPCLCLPGRQRHKVA